MTRKHYEAIADVLACFAGPRGIAEQTRCSIAYNLASVLAKDNPRFDRHKFLKAADVPTTGDARDD